MNPVLFSLCYILINPTADVNEKPTNTPPQHIDVHEPHKSVQFDLSPDVVSAQTPLSPELSPRTLPRSDESDNSRLDGQSDHLRRNTNSGAKRPSLRAQQSARSTRRPRSHSESDATPPPPRHEHRGRRHEDSDADSNETEVLPDRFDAEGRKLPDGGEDPFAVRVEDILRGRGTAGRIFSRFAGDLMGSSSSSGRGRYA